MLRGLYAAAAGMDLQQVVLNVTSNNLANATTPGFKQDRVVATSFPEVLLWHLEQEPVQAVGTWSYTAAVAATVTDFTPGPLRETGHATDLAPLGDGYFTVETPQGTRYTRHGSFRIDGEGYLVTVHGDRVLGEDGPLRVEDPDFTVAGDGTIRRQGLTVGRLALARFADPGVLQKEGDYFTAPAGAAGPAPETEVLQGYLEGANVALADRMVDLMAALRSYAAAARLAQVYDELLGRATTQLGVVR